MIKQEYTLSLLEQTLSLEEYTLSLQEHALSILQHTMCSKHSKVHSKCTLSLGLLQYIQYNKLLKYTQNILEAIQSMLRAH